MTQQDLLTGWSHVPLPLPKHIICHITHNEYIEGYASVSDYLMELEIDCLPDDRVAMMETNEIWEIQWYPTTPIGFHIVVAATLERAIELANQVPT